MNGARRASILVVALAVSGVTALSAWGTAPGANGDLVFRRYFDDSHTWGAIFTATTHGARLRQLTHPPKGVLDNVPDWSPDGTRIAFQRVDPNGCGPGCETDDIWVVTRDGKRLTRIAYDPAGKGCFGNGQSAGGICRNAPGWSPDGRRVAFTCELQPRGERTCVVNADGTGLHELTQTPGAGEEDVWPQWSPNGRRLVVQRVLGNRRAVFVIDADGKNPRRLTPWSLRGGEPDWAPDGKLIVFTSNEDGPSSTSANLYTVRPDGSGLRQLTHARGGHVQYLSASFSPDGKWLTVSRTPGSGRKGNADVYVMHADGTGLRQVTRAATWESSTDWGSR
jgi:Tol biopolymer transport system component